MSAYLRESECGEGLGEFGFLNVVAAAAPALIQVGGMLGSAAISADAVKYQANVTRQIAQTQASLVARQSELDAQVAGAQQETTQRVAGDVTKTLFMLGALWLVTR